MLPRDEEELIAEREGYDAALRAPEPIEPVAIPVPPAAAPAVPVPGYGDAEALRAAEASRGESDRAAALLDAAALINRGFGGTAGDLGGQARATREDSLKDVLRRRAMADQDSALQKRQREEAVAKALALGDSPESVRLKEQFGATTIGKMMRERMGDDAWTRLPGSSLPGPKDQFLGEIDLAKAGMKNKPDPKLDGTSELSVGAVQRAKTLMQQYDPALAAKLGDSIDGMTFVEVTEKVYPLMSAEAKARWGKEIAGIQARNRVAASDESASNRFDLKLAERQVGGFHPRKGVIPSDFQARKLSELSASTDTTLESLSTVRKGFEKYGPEFFFGKARAMGLPSLEDARLRAKELYNLGVLNGQDYAIVSRIIPDPNTLRAGAFPKDFLTQMTTVDRILRRALARTAYRYNYEPDAPVTAPETPGSAPAGLEAPALPTGTAVKEPKVLEVQGRRIVEIDGEFFEAE
jgi:hypothetical protein